MRKGVVLLFIQHIVVLIGGLSLMTFAFFGAHTVASRMVSTHAGIGKSSATCLYWLIYYSGSSVVGYLTGFAFFHYGWNALLGVDLFLLVLALIGARIFLRPRYVPGENFVLPE